MIRMQATIEISMYPLSENYEERVLGFLDAIDQYPAIKRETNGVSTLLFGELTVLFQVLEKEIGKVFSKEEQAAMFVLKIGKGELRYETKW